MPDDQNLEHARTEQNDQHVDQPDQGTGKPKGEERQDPKKGRRTLVIVAAVVVALVGATLWTLNARNYEDTDDAQIDGHLHPIAARVDGTVNVVSVEDNQSVKKGELLVQLDPRDYAVSLDQAKTAFDQAQGQAQAQNPNLPITNVTNSTNVSTGQTEVATAVAALAGAQRDRAAVLAQLRQAEANNEKAQMDLKRYTHLLERNEVSHSDYDQYLATAKAQAAMVEQQQASLSSSEKTIEQKTSQLEEQRLKLQQSQRNAPRQVEIQRANIASSEANAHNAKAKLDQAALNLDYTRIYAPSSGIITQRSAETGGKVSVGQQLMVVVETGNLWVTANFRETQLRKMHVGQQVKIHVDTLDEDFSGTIENMPAASGDRISVLPPENATGNYVKIVQRFPVRIRFAPNQRGLEGLRPGMSVEPRVALR